MFSSKSTFIKFLKKRLSFGKKNRKDYAPTGSLIKDSSRSKTDTDISLDVGIEQVVEGGWDPNYYMDSVRRGDEESDGRY